MSLRDDGLAKTIGQAIDKAPVNPETLVRQLTADIIRTIMEGAEKGLPVEQVYAQLDLRNAQFYEDIKPLLKEGV